MFIHTSYIAYLTRVTIINLFAGSYSICTFCHDVAMINDLCACIAIHILSNINFASRKFAF